MVVVALLLLLSIELGAAWILAPPSSSSSARHQQPPPWRLQSSAEQSSSLGEGPTHTRGDALRIALAGLSLAVRLPSSTNAAVVGGGAAGGKQQQEGMAGPTYREKGRPALLEALVYLPKGMLCFLVVLTVCVHSAHLTDD